MTEAEFLHGVRENPVNAELLLRLRSLGLRECHLTAGCLFQTVWNRLCGREAPWGVRTTTSSISTMRYLARRFPEAVLLPRDTEGEAQAVSCMSFAAATLHPARRQGLGHATSVYQLADQRIAGRDWVLGSYSTADIHLFRLFWRLNASLRPSPDVFPHLIAHHNQMLARPAVRRTIEAEANIGYELPV